MWGLSSYANITYTVLHFSPDSVYHLLYSSYCLLVSLYHKYNLEGTWLGLVWSGKNHNYLYGFKTHRLRCLSGPDQICELDNNFMFWSPVNVPLGNYRWVLDHVCEAPHLGCPSGPDPKCELGNNFMPWSVITCHCHYLVTTDRY